MSRRRWTGSPASMYTASIMDVTTAIGLGCPAGAGQALRHQCTYGTSTMDVTMAIRLGCPAGTGQALRHHY